jgi:hypothetical protein
MLSPNKTSIQQRTFSRWGYYHIFFGDAFNLLGSPFIFGLPDAHERVVRSHDHDMTRCTVCIVFRLRHHITRLWRFVRAKHAPSAGVVGSMLPCSARSRGVTTALIATSIS